MCRRQARSMLVLLAIPGFVAAMFSSIGGCPPDQLADLERLLGRTPVAESLNPAQGVSTGGTKVTVRGRNFTPTTGVLFGGLTASNVTFVNPALIEVITPAGAPGVVDVEFTNGGAGAEVVSGGFEYLSPPPPPPDPPAAPAPPPEPPAEPPPAPPALELTAVTPAEGPTGGGTRVTIQGSGFEPGAVVLFGGHLGIEPDVENSSAISVVTPSYAEDTVDVIVLAPDGRSVQLDQAFRFVAPVEPEPAEDAARVVGAAARNTTTVYVTFTREMGAGAEEAASYRITGSDTAFLVVTDARFKTDDRSVVILTTLTQAADIYTVHVTDVKDAEGNPMAAPDGLLSPPNGPDPTQARFAGIPPGSVAEQIDTDGDTFADWFEMQGWMVTVRFTNGTISTFHVTSDPFNPDTDGDGFSDAIENALSLDPRTDDTDADLVSDPEEHETWLSNPADQDTDADGFGLRPARRPRSLRRYPM